MAAATAVADAEVATAADAEAAERVEGTAAASAAAATAAAATGAVARTLPGERAAKVGSAPRVAAEVEAAWAAASVEAA